MKSAHKIIDNFYFPKKTNYLVYWLLLGIVYFLLSEITIRIFNETSYFELRLATCALFVAVGINSNFARKKLMYTIKELEVVIEFPEETNQWLTKFIQTAFTFKTKVSKLIFFIILLISVLIMSICNFPFQDTFANILLIIGLIPIIGICSIGAYSIPKLLFLLREIVHSPINIPFYSMNHHSLSSLKDFYSQSWFFVSLCYAWFVTTMWLSPYKLEGIVLIFTIVLGFYPLAMFIWSKSQINFLFSRINRQNIESACKITQTAWQKYRENPNPSNTKLLKKQMKIQNNIETQNDGRLDLAETISLIAIIISAITPIIVALVEIYS